MLHSTKHLLFLFLTLLTTTLLPDPSTTHPRTTTFHFPPFPLQNLTFLGDAHHLTTTTTTTLTLDSPFPSSGTIIYTTPIRFTDSRTNSTTSFSTTFSFSILNLNRDIGGGFSFFISPLNNTLGSPSPYLGLLNSSHLTLNKFIAIEYDTRLDPYFNDPNDNHVGFDIDSLNSIQTADCGSLGIDLKTGFSFTSWIDYVHDRNTLEVFLTCGAGFKPEYPILNVSIDLSGYFQEVMVPSVKPKVSFSSDMPLSVDDLMRYVEHDEQDIERSEEHEEENGSDCEFEICID